MKVSQENTLYCLILLSMMFVSTVGADACATRIFTQDDSRVILNETQMVTRDTIMRYESSAKAVEIVNCDLYISFQALYLLSTYSVLTHLTVLNSSMSKADFLVLRFQALTNMRFNGNNISSFNLELVANLVDLDLSFNGLKSFRLGVGSHLFLKTINLSNNNLVQLTIVSTLRDLQSVDLSNNKLVTLDFAAGMTASINSLQLDMTNNDLVCSPNLTMEWMILKSKNTLLVNETTCHFPGSNSSYLVSEHGLHFTNESDIFETIWSKKVLQAYLQFSSVKVAIETNADSTKIRWMAEKPINSSSYLIYRSAEGNEIDTDVVNLNKGEKLVPDTSKAVEVCFSTLLRKPTEEGLVDTKVTMRCSTLSKLIVITNIYQYAFLGVSGFGVFYILVSIGFCICLCRCLRKKNKTFKTNTVVLEELQSNSMYASRDTVVTNNIYIENDTMDTVFCGKDEKIKVVDYNPYLPMESTEPGGQENDEDIYDGMVYDQIKDSPPYVCDVIKDTENIYEKC